AELDGQAGHFEQSHLRHSPERPLTPSRPGAPKTLAGVGAYPPAPALRRASHTSSHPCSELVPRRPLGRKIIASTSSAPENTMRCCATAGTDVRRSSGKYVMKPAPKTEPSKIPRPPSTTMLSSSMDKRK